MYWTNYENGFGNLNEGFWLEKGKINHLTKGTIKHSIRVDLGDFDGNTSYAQYTTFSVGDSTTEYNLTIGGYSGTAGDALIKSHNGRKFTTRDNDNDYQASGNCAQIYPGAWWYISIVTIIPITFGEAFLLLLHSQR